MKKLISIFIVSLMFVGLAWAQGTLNFDEPEVTLPSSYSDGSFTVDGITWSYGHSRDQATYPIDNNGLMIRRASDSYLQATIPGGVGNFSFQYRKAYTAANANRQLELIVNDVVVATTPEFGGAQGADATVHTLSHDVQVAGNVSVKIKVSGTSGDNRQTTLDNIVWTSFGDGPIDPLLVVTPLNLDDFFYTEGEGPSAVQNFAAQGSYLNGDIEFVVDNNFEIALDNEGPFTDVLTLTAVDETVASTPIYVRMAAGLSVGNYTGNITVSTPDADDKVVVLEGEVYNATPTDGYFVDFEGNGETKNAYASGTVNLSGLDWDLTEALINPDANDWRNGARSVRIRAYSEASMTMLEDKANGLGTLSFLYRRYGTNAQEPWKVEYSNDGGDSWTQIGTEFTATGDVQEFNAAVNVAGNVRVRFVSTTTSDENKRTNIDDIYLTDYTGGLPVATTPVFSPDGGYYTEAQNVSITTATEDATIRYTIDGSDPSETDGEIYENPIEISEETTLKAIAYKVGYVNSAIRTAEYTFPVPPTIVENIAELRAGATDGTVYHLTGEVILTNQNASRNAKHIQDATAAIAIDDDDGNISTEYALYDGITGITGTLNLYYGLLQFVPTADPGAATSSDNVVEPVLKTVDELTSADQSKLVKVKGLQFVGAGENFGSGTQNLNAIDANDNTIVIRTFPNTDYSGTTIPTEAFDLIAVVCQYNTTMQLQPRFLADFLPTYDHDKDDVVIIDDETLAQFDGENFLGADDVEVLDDDDYTPFPNADFTPTVRGKWMLYGTGTVTITVHTDNDWFAWIEGGEWNTIEGGNVHNIDVNLDAKDAVFEFMTGNGTNPTLPVELSYFTAIYMVENSSVMLSWKTESETQMLGYRIYRSEDRELENSIMITPVMIDATNSSTGGKYSHTDNELNEGTYYYWLEAVGYNSSDYYGYQSVLVENPAVPELPSISSMSNAYPNPFRNSTKVDIEVKAGETANFTVYNMLGQAVYTRTLPEGQTILEWNGLDKNGKRCGSGIYFYKLSSPSASQTKKVVLMK
ncbi:MAG: chitobiase/beta-hexosaminidase C-terminal domain-containing protein [Candidatus Cloacimonadaceae bacterium]